MPMTTGIEVWLSTAHTMMVAGGHKTNYTGIAQLPELCQLSAELNIRIQNWLNIFINIGSIFYCYNRNVQKT